MSRANTHGLVMLTLVHLPIVSHLFSSHLYSRNSTLQELYLVYYMTQLLNIYCTPRFTIESTRISARATNWNWATCSLTRLLLSLSLSPSLCSLCSMYSMGRIAWNPRIVSHSQCLLFQNLKGCVDLCLLYITHSCHYIANYYFIKFTCFFFNHCFI